MRIGRRNACLTGLFTILVVSLALAISAAPPSVQAQGARARRRTATSSGAVPPGPDGGAVLQERNGLEGYSGC